MPIDLLLYVALAAGVLAGWLLPHPGPWIGRATLATIVVLVGSLGLRLGAVPLGILVDTIPIALLFTALILGVTLGVEQVWIRRTARTRRSRPPDGTNSTRRHLWLPPALLGALLLGLSLGRSATLPSEDLLTASLYVLLFLVGFDLKIHLSALRTVAIPTVSSVVGASVAALLISLGLGLPLGTTLATSFAFGWYSLAGPLLASSIGPAAGMLAFLTNFFRENATMLSAPVVGQRLRGEGLAAMGGATSMDTTLYFVTRYGDPDSGTLALSSGLILTVAASLLVPLFLGLGAARF